MNEVTLDHVRQACRWARTAEHSTMPICGLRRMYDQHTWDCGTSCCIWGAANILAGNGPAYGPPVKWMEKSLAHSVTDALMCNGWATPEQVEWATNLTEEEPIPKEWPEVIRWDVEDACGFWRNQSIKDHRGQEVRR